MRQRMLDCRATTLNTVSPPLRDSYAATIMPLPRCRISILTVAGLIEIAALQAIDPKMRFHPEIPLVALLGLMHLGIARLVGVLGRGRRADDRRVDDRAGGHPSAPLLPSAAAARRTAAGPRDTQHRHLIVAPRQLKPREPSCATITPRQSWFRRDTGLSSRSSLLLIHSAALHPGRTPMRNA